MVSGKQIRIDKTPDPLIDEKRLIDTQEMRLSEIAVRTHAESVSRLRDRLMQSLEDFDINVATGPMQVCMALEEALANAFYHGNLELDSSLKEDGTSRFMDLAKERCQVSPYKERILRVTELAMPFGLWITISDEGKGFDVRAAQQRVQEPINLLASGRGLVMMKAFTDELLFNTTGNEVTLVIYNSKNVDIREMLKARARASHLAAKRSLA